MNEWTCPQFLYPHLLYNLPLTHVAHWFTLLLISPCMFHHCQTSFLVLSHLPTGESGGWTVFTPQNSGAKAGSCGWNSSLPLKPKWSHHQQAPRCGEPCSHSDQFLSSLRLQLACYIDIVQERQWNCHVPSVPYDWGTPICLSQWSCIRIYWLHSVGKWFPLARSLSLRGFFKCTSHVWENVQPKYFSLSHQFLRQSADRRASVQRRNSPIGGETPPPELRDQGRIVQGSWSFSCQGQTVPISPPGSTAALTTALTLCLDKGWSQPKWGSEDGLFLNLAFKTSPQT